MPDFADFDRRRYRAVDVATGYDSWAPTYEQTVLDDMDLALLERLHRPPWDQVRRAADLGCGTGRTAAWLRERSPATIDGIDLSEGMLARARVRGIHASLTHGDVRATGLPGGSYDLVIACLIDEHLPDLTPLYAEARRLAAPGGVFVSVSYHPGWQLAELTESAIDGTWIAAKPKWAHLRGHPFTMASVWV
ncbi:class I SAM-dependent DNA methyltransferase [Nocardia sp. CA-290969]|uniref:class I SAM-dependent DNA methyltransferase n=1 Tax=Nocardia sp. CA-290969 TaxID=3239986 RepID=UPI003D89C85E